MESHGFLAAGHAQNGAFDRCDADLSHTARNDRALSTARSRCDLGGYRSCTVMHDGVLSRKVATSGRAGPSNRLHLQETARVTKQDGHRTYSISGLASELTPPLKPHSTSSLSRTQPRIDGYSSRRGIDLLIVRAIERVLRDALQ